MGLAGLFGWGGVDSWLEPRRNTLLGLSSDLLSGNPGGGKMMAGKQMDDANAIRAKEEATRAEQIKQAAAAARAAGNEKLAQLFEGMQAVGPAVDLHSVLYPQTAAGEGFTLSPGQTRYGPNNEVLASAPPAPPDPGAVTAAAKEEFDRSHALWQEHAASNPVKTYHEVKNGYERVRTSYLQAAATENTPEGAGAADISMIFAYMKMLDPTSVVREGEQATAANAGGIPATVQNMYNSLLKGDKLSAGVRQQFMQMAESLYKEAAQNLQGQNKLFEPRIRGFGIDPSTILFEPEVYQSIKYPGVTIRPFNPGGR